MVKRGSIPVCLLGIIPIIMASGPSFAGDLGAQSRASVSITITIQPGLRISDIRRSPNTWPLKQGMPLDSLCVLSNAPRSRYTAVLIGQLNPASGSRNPRPVLATKTVSGGIVGTDSVENSQVIAIASCLGPGATIAPIFSRGLRLEGIRSSSTQLMIVVSPD